MGLLKEEYYPSYTYDEYALWEGDWELIEGVPYAMAPAPMIKHQAISNQIARVLSEALDECNSCQALLAVDWKISNKTVVQPDNLVICHTPMHEAYLVKAPEIVFEILSVSTRHKDTGIKFDLYEQEGVRYYVIVDPQTTLAKIYMLNSEGRYSKPKDVSDEVVVFALSQCTLSFNFSKIWS